MKFVQSLQKASYQPPAVQITSLFDDQLIVIVRAWSGVENSPIVVEEINQYLSSTQADLELTTPFQYIEGLSSLSNRLRIASLLANDRIFKFENKETYSSAFEIALVYKKKEEISWLTLGGFELIANFKNSSRTISASGEVIDQHHLLPAHLLGVEKSPVLLTGSLHSADVLSLQIMSYFDNNQTEWNCLISDV